MKLAKFIALNFVGGFLVVCLLLNAFANKDQAFISSTIAWCITFQMYNYCKHYD